MVYVILPKKDRIRMNSYIKEYLESFVTKHNIKITFVYIHKKMYERNQFERYFNTKTDVFLFHPSIIKENITELKKYADDYPNIIGMVPFRKPYHHEPTKHYPVDEQDAIWKMFRLCFMDDEEIDYKSYVVPEQKQYLQITQQHLKRLIINNGN